MNLVELVLQDGTSSMSEFAAMSKAQTGSLQT